VASLFYFPSLSFFDNIINRTALSLTITQWVCLVPQKGVKKVLQHVLALFDK
jgi:hypothetical protein